MNLPRQIIPLPTYPFLQTQKEIFGVFIRIPRIGSQRRCMISREKEKSYTQNTMKTIAECTLTHDVIFFLHDAVFWTS